jgi:predicted Zn-dependent peptidase
MKMYQDNITRNIFDYIISQIFKGTPLEKTIIGTENNIKKFTKNDIQNFRKLYTIENSLFVIVGNFEKNKIINIIKKTIKNIIFNHIKIDEPKIIYTITSNKPNVYIIPNKNLNQSYLFLSFYFNKFSFQEECIMNFLTFYLSSGSTSKLFEVLRNKLGASYSNDCDILNFRCENGLFYIFCNINNSLIMESLKEILLIIKNLKNINILIEDMNKVKKIFETNNLFQINNPNYLMMYHGKNYLFNKNKNIIEELEFISKLNSKNIKDFSNIFFIKKNLNIFIYGNDIDQSQYVNIINEF